MKVKICGVTHPDDAAFAAKNGADFIGLIFSPHSKRMVDIETAKLICAEAIKYGAKPVAVFVDESYETINTVCKNTGINIIQLHGDGSRKFVSDFKDIYTIFYVAIIGADGAYTLPFDQHIYPLFDIPKNNENDLTIKFNHFTPPQRPWILAGGLNEHNVAKTIQLLNLYAVDVSRGVEQENTIRKDPEKILAFIQAAKGQHS